MVIIILVINTNIIVITTDKLATEVPKCSSVLSKNSPFFLYFLPSFLPSYITSTFYWKKTQRLIYLFNYFNHMRVVLIINICNKYICRKEWNFPVTVNIPPPILLFKSTLCPSKPSSSRKSFPTNVWTTSRRQGILLRSKQLSVGRHNKHPSHTCSVQNGVLKEGHHLPMTGGRSPESLFAL